MKRSKLIFLSAGLIAVCFAFTTRAHVKRLPAAYKIAVGCTLVTRPVQCSGGTTICTVNGTTYYSDMNCTSPDFLND